jgi:hypothetical protein
VWAVLCGDTGAKAFRALNETTRKVVTMKYRFRSLLLALGAVAALGAAGASGASAHEFRVEGKALTGEEASTGTGGVSHFEWKIGGGTIKFECKTSTSAETLLGLGKLKPGRLSLHECKVTTPTGCTVNEPEIDKTGQLGTVKEALGVEFAGSGSFEELTKLIIGSCALAGEYPVTGHWTCELHEAGVEAVEHEEVCKAVNSRLKIGTETATFGYTDKVKLTSGKKWSAL